MSSEEDLYPLHRRVLELYQEGWNPAAIAEEVERPRRTVVNIASALRKKGFAVPYGSVGGARPKGETVAPERGGSTKASRPAAGAAQPRSRSGASSAQPSSVSPEPAQNRREAGAEQAPRKPQAVSDDLMETLQEMAEWWRSKQRGDPEDGCAEPAPRKPGATIARGDLRRQTYRIEEELIARLKERADQTGESMAVLVNEALRRYLGG